MSVSNEADIPDSVLGNQKSRFQSFMFDILRVEPRSPSRLNEIRVNCCRTQKNNGDAPIRAGWTNTEANHTTLNPLLAPPSLCP